MREVPKDNKWVEEPVEGTSEPQNAPSETELVIVSLLMRLYDINMAMLSKVDPVMADKVWDAHNEGKHFNPEIYVPLSEVDNAD